MRPRLQLRVLRFMLLHTAAPAIWNTPLHVNAKWSPNKYRFSGARVVRRSVSGAPNSSISSIQDHLNIRTGIFTYIDPQKTLKTSHIYIYIYMHNAHIDIYLFWMVYDCLGYMVKGPFCRRVSATYSEDCPFCLTLAPSLCTSNLRQRSPQTKHPPCLHGMHHD